MSVTRGMAREITMASNPRISVTTSSVPGPMPPVHTAAIACPGLAPAEGRSAVRQREKFGRTR